MQAQAQTKPLFGVTALDMGYLDASKLTHALYIQQMRNKLSEYHSRLGEICEEMGYLTHDQVQTIIDRSHIHQLPAYLRPFKSKEKPPSTASESSSAPASPPNEAAVSPSAETTSGSPAPVFDERTLKHEELLSRYLTAVEQIKEYTRIIQDLRIQNKDLAIRADLAENEAAALRRRLQSAASDQSRNGWISRG